MTVPVYRFAKVPRLNVNSQGVPNRKKPLPIKAKPKAHPSSVQLPQYNPVSKPAAPEEEAPFEYDDAPIPQEQTAPEYPNNHPLEGAIQAGDYPMEDLGINTQGIAPHFADPDERNEFLSNLPYYGKGFGTPSHQAMSVILHAIDKHGSDVVPGSTSQTIRHGLRQGAPAGLPFGHYRLSEPVPGHVHVNMHMPEGHTTSFRTRVGNNGELT